MLRLNRGDAARRGDSGVGHEDVDPPVAVATGSESGTQTASWTGSVYRNAALAAYSGADTGTLAGGSAAA